MKNMTFYRDDHDSNFTRIHNNILKNTNLSLKAKGLMCELISERDDFVFSKKSFTKFSKDGKDSINTALKELEENGYVKISRKWINSKLRLFITVYENPAESNPDFPHQDSGVNAAFQSNLVGNSDSDGAEKPQVLTTNILTTNLLTTTEVSSSSSFNNIDESKPLNELKIFVESRTGFKFSDDFYIGLKKLHSKNGIEEIPYVEWFLKNKIGSGIKNVQNYIFKSITIPNIVEEFKVSSQRSSLNEIKEPLPVVICPKCGRKLSSMDFTCGSCSCGLYIYEFGSFKPVLIAEGAVNE